MALLNVTITNKMQAAILAGLSGFWGFVAWLATVPPETASGILGQFVEIMPVTWRPAIGLFTRFLTFAFGVYAAYKMAPHAPVPLPPPPPGPQVEASAGTSSSIINPQP